MRTDNELRTFDEALKLFGFDSFRLQLNLQRHEDGEEELVLLVESSSCVWERAKRQTLDDVLDAFRCDRRLGGACHRQIEQLQKLSQRRLVHDVDDAHLDDQEVENGATSCNCKVSVISDAWMPHNTPAHHRTWYGTHALKSRHKMGISCSALYKCTTCSSLFFGLLLFAAVYDVFKFKLAQY